MKALRPALHALVALSLLVQGVAVAAAPLMAPKPAAEARAMADMPCHGQEQASKTTAPCDCCDGTCMDMAHCAFAHVAAVLPSAGLALAAVREGAIAAPTPFAESVTLPSRLRPPISRA